MGFVKILKNGAYSSRMQTKPRRRRSGKTDYFARRRLVFQDKNKYDQKKYRLVVRRTNSKFILQIIYSNMNGDVVMTAAESTELKQHGLTVGLTNFSAAYATGLLLARRLLKKVGLADLYKVNEEINGEYFNVDEDPDEDKRPFKALLDVVSRELPLVLESSVPSRVLAMVASTCPTTPRDSPVTLAPRLRRSSTREVRPPVRSRSLRPSSRLPFSVIESSVSMSPTT